MQTVSRMTRLNYNVDEALQRYANDKKWSKSFAISEIVSNSKVISDYLTLVEKNNEKAA